mgnify:CR=1 FL=1
MMRVMEEMKEWPVTEGEWESTDRWMAKRREGRIEERKGGLRREGEKRGERGRIEERSR